MQKNMLSVDIGSFNIKIVESVLNGGKMEILNYVIGRTPDNAVNDGKITDVERVASAIRELLTKNYIKTKNAVCTVSSTSLVTREVNIPKMNEADIEKYISVDSQQYFPMDLTNYIIDFKILDEVIGKDGAEYMLLLAAIPQMIVNDYIKVFDKLGIELWAIDIMPNVLAKYCENYLTSQAGNDSIAIIDIGAGSTTVNVLANGVLQFSRLLPGGGSEITQNIATSFNLGQQEAEDYKLKNAELLVDSYGSESLANTISESIKPIIDSTISQINKFFEFYRSRSPLHKINAIYLVGGGSLLKGMDKYYQVVFNVPTKRVDLTDGIVNRSNKPTAQRDLPIILNAFSATYRE